MIARGFSLIEMMVSLAIVGVVAALAVPSMLPAVHIETLTGAGTVVGGFVANARLTAMAQHRCVRVRIQSATAPPVLVAERLNSFDCEDPATAPLIETGSPLWIEIGKQPLDKPSLELAFDPAPSETAGEIRFRPSGRLWSNDADLTDDDGVIKVTHPLLSGTNTIKVLADTPGMVCVLPRGLSPPGSANNLGCL